MYYVQLVNVQQGKFLKEYMYRPAYIIYNLLFRNSASCTHVSALLHALVSLTSPQFQISPNESTAMDHLADEIPITSLPCQWKAPKKRKESTLPIAQVKFEKHTKGRTKTRKYDLLENFDP